jgi:hypothetical protein
LPGAICIVSLQGSWYYPQRTRCYASAVGATTHYPRMGAAQ